MRMLFSVLITVGRCSMKPECESIANLYIHYLCILRFKFWVQNMRQSSGDYTRSYITLWPMATTVQKSFLRVLSYSFKSTYTFNVNSHWGSLEIRTYI